MTQEERYPYGECECRDGCSCAGIPGPAAEVVTRGERRLKVCTRCTLSGDTEREWLFTESTPQEPFVSYDALGAMCGIMALAAKRTDQHKGVANPRNDSEGNER